MVIPPDGGGEIRLYPKDRSLHDFLVKKLLVSDCPGPKGQEFRKAIKLQRCCLGNMSIPGPGRSPKIAMINK